MVDSPYSFFEPSGFIQKAVEQKTLVNKCCLTILILAILALLSAAITRAAPQSYITEEVLAGYFYNGTPAGPVTRNGYVEVDVGSTQDVLQYIRLSLTGTEGTNLRSVTAFRNVAASPNLPEDRTRIFVNTTSSGEDLSYQITNTSLTPVIAMRMDYANRDGGKEIHPGANTFLFNVTLNASKTLTGVSMVIQARRNTFGINDSMNFTGVSAPSGSPRLLDTDSDGFNDRVFWTGNLPGNDFNLSFTGTAEPGVNFDGNLMYVNLDEGLSYCIYTGSETFTGIAFSNRFSRGSIREGIEMVLLGTWITRGFIKNTASNTSYILHGWDLYQLGNPVPVLSSSQVSYMLPGETKYTEWYDTQLTDKPAYYSGSFNWEIVWGTSGYAKISRSSMDMPTLYEMDSWADGVALLQSNSQSGKRVLVAIATRHLGQSGINVNSFRANSTLPRFAAGGGGATTWIPSLVRLFYSNGSTLYDITSSAYIETSNSDSGNGFVYASIDNISSAIGHYMTQNDNIILSYLASGQPNSANNNYSFRTNTTLVTLSGTPVTKIVEPYVIVPGIFIPGEQPVPGGGGAVALPAPYADIVKESADAYFVAANVVNVIVSAAVVDSGGKGIKDVKVLAYAPGDSEIDTSSVSLRIYRNSTGRWEELGLDEDFMVVDRGLTKIGKDEYREYLIKKTTPPGSISENTIDMLNGDRIEISYKVKVPFGTSYLLTRIFGYSYYEDRIIFEDAYIPVRREIGQLEKLRIEESEWVQGESVVGSSVKWMKTFRVYNPNNVSVEEVIATNVFQDSLSAEVGEAGRTEKTKLSLRGGNQTIVNWYARLGRMERKTYMIEIYTPPVLETKREMNVLESNKTTIRLMANITMENFGMEGYSNVTLLFPVKREKILMISDPTVLMEEYGEGSVKIIMQWMNGFEVRNVSVMYMETPPIMVTTLNTIKYSCSDSADMTIFVVPSEADVMTYIETEIIGPEPQFITAHAEILDMGKARPYEEIKIPLRISLSTFPSGKYFAYTKFRKDFGIILSDKKEFFIDCPGRDLKSISWIFVLAASLVIVGLLAARVYRKRSYEKELAELRKKVKEI